MDVSAAVQRMVDKYLTGVVNRQEFARQVEEEVVNRTKAVLAQINSKVPAELHDLSGYVFFDDGYSRHCFRIDDKLVQIIEAFTDGDLFGWVYTTADGYIGSYTSSGPVYRGEGSNITDDEYVTNLHWLEDFADAPLDSFTQADITAACGPDADQNGDVTRAWAVKRLLKIAESKKVQVKA